LLANKRYRGTATLSINDLRSYYGTSNSQFAVFLYLLDERQKEFMHEGMRWFDIKRFGIPVVHILDNGSSIRLEEEDERKVLQIPQSAIDVGGLEPNPR
jgi:starch-binding outer membrane protein, SusD/RagB family